MAQMIEPSIETFAQIKVVGVGGAGGAAVNRMVEAGVDGVQFIAINTDAQALHHSKADVKLHIGKDTTKGLGSGADPAIGQLAAEEAKDEIRKVLEGADMVFITIGAGGGTGSGAGHIVAEVAKELGILVVGFATKPFAFEGEKRRKNADEAIDKLRTTVDTLIIIPNDRLLQTIDRQTPLLEAFKVADDVLRQGVQGISDLITVHGLINLDFADVKSVMSNAGSALMGIGRASGENRAVVAAQQAIESPLLEVSIDGARGVLFNVIGGNDLSMHEINAAAETITSAVDPTANIIFGATINPDLDGEVIITVVATGFDASYFSPKQNDSLESIKSTDSSISEPIVRDLDLDLSTSQDDDQNDFTKEVDVPNIWTIHDDKEMNGFNEDNQTETDSSSNSNSDDEIESKSTISDPSVSNVDSIEDELDKPSFLRRITKRHKEKVSSEDDSKDTEK